MDKLTQLLDERWPSNPKMSFPEITSWELLREAFKDGYNARIAEEKEQYKAGGDDDNGDSDPIYSQFGNR